MTKALSRWAGWSALCCSHAAVMFSCHAECMIYECSVEFIALELLVFMFEISFSHSTTCFFQFFDLNNDSYSDLLIGAPFRSDDVTEEIFGGKTWPRGYETFSMLN